VTILTCCGALPPAYTAAMEQSPPTLRTGHWNGPFAPLSLAVYITWVAVAASPLVDCLHGRLQPGWKAFAGVVGMVMVLALYVLRTLCKEPGGDDLRQMRWIVLPQLPFALLACWGFASDSMPVLLIIVAGQLAVLYPLRVIALLMLAADLPLLWLLAQRWGWSAAVVSLFTYVGFQVFAGLVTAYARNAEDARDDALRLNAELLATRQLLMESVRGEERLRLSHELHDVVGHKLTALKLQLRLHARQPQREPERAIAECERLADELLTDVRGVVGALRRDEGIPLQQALSALAPALPEPQVLLELAPEARAPGVAQAQALLRCAQEGLTNALRHSGAARVVIRLREEESGIALSVEDDGRARQLPKPGNGLSGMRERLEALGGRLDLALREGGGLRLRAWLPQTQSGAAL
jgi:signal transduction histidine kinase